MFGGNKKISSWKWVVLFILTGVVDIVQFVIDWSGVGIAFSEAAEPFIGAGIIILCELFGIRVITKPKRIVSLLCVGVADALTGGFAPFWILDIWYIRGDVRSEEEEAENQNVLQQFELPTNQGPLHTTDSSGNPVRLPPDKAFR